MKAIVINSFGKADKVFEQKEISLPTIGKDEVLVKVLATAVNPIDYKIRQGLLPHLIVRFPAILQGDISGIVEKVGVDVRDFKPGDKVYGCTGGYLGLGGGLGEYMKTSSNLLALKPDSLSFVEAAALTSVAITAYQAVYEKVNIKPGQKVFIYGGTGGVGHIAVQLATFQGAEVHASVSDDDKAKVVKSLGAKYAINYHRETVETIVNNYTNGKGFDVVIDLVGNENLVNSFSLTKLEGDVVTILALKSVDLTLIHEKALSLHAIYVAIPLIYKDKKGMEKLGHTMSRISELVDSHGLRPLINRVFPFSDVAAAHSYAECGGIIGKVVISDEV